jgi:DNA-binding XRE family transcriptional regulator
MSSTSHIYVIAAGDNAVKIGIARDPEKRRASLQTSHYIPLKIAFSAPCKRPAVVERLVHESLASKRLYGEWFNASPQEAQQAISEVIKRTRLPGESALPIESWAYSGASQLRKARAILKLTSVQAAKGAKVHPNTLARIESGADARSSTVKKIEEFYKSKGVELLPDGSVVLTIRLP